MARHGSIIDATVRETRAAAADELPRSAGRCASPGGVTHTWDEVKIRLWARVIR